MVVNYYVRFLLLGFLLVVIIVGLFLFGALTVCDRSGGFVVNPLDPFSIYCVPVCDVVVFNNDTFVVPVNFSGFSSDV